MDKIRNFSIIAHIDHGKSTLADRMLEMTGTVSNRDMKDQALDRMDLERERGITIKLTPVRMKHKGYQLNLIDTPGHVDFTYEVSRSLAACEGAILVVDASQGIEAQTLANTYLALEHNLEIIPILNKIDLPAARPDQVAQDIEDFLGIPKEEVLHVSAKTGQGVTELLDKIVEKIPTPKNVGDDPRALIFDSVYDPYRGVVIYIRNFGGQFQRGDKAYLMGTKYDFEILETGFFAPDYTKAEGILPGEVGYIVTGLKSVEEARVGDTLTLLKSKNSVAPLPGYKKVTPFVFASVFTTDSDKYPQLREALEKLKLNDAALDFEPEQSTALGFGFRCGFLGLLHLEVVQERLEREFDLDLIATAPSVSYEVETANGEKVRVTNPADWPDPAIIKATYEPVVKAEILLPSDRMGGVMKLCEICRGTQLDIKYPAEGRAQLIYEIPLSEVVIDFYDRLKSVSAGYASFAYEFAGMREEKLVRVNIRVAEEEVPALSFIVPHSQAENRGRSVCKKLKDILPREMFAVAIQAAVGAKIVARETLSAMRKDVTGYLYGGDRTRKDKLLKKQAAGKKRMKKFGKVQIPQEAFLALLKRD